MEFENWYWSYKYGSKLACIRFIESSDLSEEEKKTRIDYHKSNLGKSWCDIYEVEFIGPKVPPDPLDAGTRVGDRMGKAFLPIHISNSNVVMQYKKS